MLKKKSRKTKQKKQIIGVDESTGKETNTKNDESTGKETNTKNADQIIPYNPKNNLEVNPRKAKNTKKIFFVGDSMIKNITGIGISRSNTVKMGPRPGAAIVDLCDYIKPEYVINPM